MKTLTTVLALAWLTLAAAPAAAQPTVIIVRHAERADSAGGGNAMMAADPDLSETGRARAESLARMLKDAGITAIYTTEFKRTRQTAAPLAALLKLEPAAVAARTPTPLLEALKMARGHVLVVGHSNTVPDILRGLGVKTPVTIADDEFDNLFIVTLGPQPTLVRLRYR